MKAFYERPPAISKNVQDYIALADAVAEMRHQRENLGEFGKITPEFVQEFWRRWGCARRSLGTTDARRAARSVPQHLAPSGGRASYTRNKGAREMTPCRVDGSKVRMWALKRDAIAAAKSIGWPANSVWPVETRFCAAYALYNNDNGFLSREDFGTLFRVRNNVTR